MSTGKFAGHTPKRWRAIEQSEHDDSGVLRKYFKIYGDGRRIANVFAGQDAELFAAAPELLAENKRLNARINSLGDELEMMAYKWGDAEKDNETLRNRVAELEELATDAYLIARVEI